MKKFSWILALLTALAMVFIGCPSGDDGGGGGPKGNPIVDGAKYFQILNRANSWDGFDIKTNKADNLSNYTANKKHTFTVIGWAMPGTEVRYSLTDSPYQHYGQMDYSGTSEGGNAGVDTTDTTVVADADVEGIFELTREFTWAELSDSNKYKAGSPQNIRIGMPTAAKEVYIYEVIIKDEDGKIVYQMSDEDSDVQAIPHGTLITDNFQGLVFLQRSGGPVITLLDPKAVGSYVPATEIPIVTTVGKTFKPITLPTEANPPVATNKAIVWTLIPKGETVEIDEEDVEVTAAATLNGNILTATEAGIVVVKATVIKGATATTDAEFLIAFKIALAAELNGNKVVMTFGSTPVDITIVPTGGTVDYFKDSTGYQFTHTADWQNASTKFAVTLPVGKTVKSYKSVTFNIDPIEGSSSGNVQYKSAGIKATAPTLTIVDEKSYLISKFPQLPLLLDDGKQEVTIDFDAKLIADVADLNVLEMSIYLHGRIESVYQFSNIVFNEGSNPCEICEDWPCTCFPCGCLCTDCRDEGECDGSKCDEDTCECSHCVDWDAMTSTPIVPTLAVDSTTPGGAFGNGAATMEMDGSSLKMTFTQTGGDSQIGWITLSDDDAALLQKVAKFGGSLKINIAGTSSSATSTFRACLGKVDTGASWNGSGWIGAAPSVWGDIVGEKAVAFNANIYVPDGDNAGSRSKYLIIQSRDGTQPVLTITSVTITVVAPVAP